MGVSVGLSLRSPTSLTPPRLLGFADSAQPTVLRHPAGFWAQFAATHRGVSARKRQRDGKGKAQCLFSPLPLPGEVARPRAGEGPFSYPYACRAAASARIPCPPLPVCLSHLARSCWWPMGGSPIGPVPALQHTTLRLQGHTRRKTVTQSLRSSDAAAPAAASRIAGLPLQPDLQVAA